MSKVYKILLIIIVGVILTYSLGTLIITGSTTSTTPSISAINNYTK